MTQITVTDKNDVAMMDIEDIRKWISLHQRALKDENMKDHWEAIENDLEILIPEYELRNPSIAILRKICEVLKSIETQLKLIIKEKEDGKN